MKTIFKQVIVLISTLLFFVGSLNAQKKYFLNSNNEYVRWKVNQAGDNIKKEVAEMSSVNYVVDKWIDAKVPGTVFTAYVDAGLEPDPNYGDNIYHMDEKKYNCPYWYRIGFDVPVIHPGKKVWLNMEGINKKARVFFNGRELGLIKGHVQRAKYDITDKIYNDRENILMVWIDVPSQNKRDDVFTNYASPTYMSSASWDWMPYVPGLNTGITDDIYLTFTGDVLLEDPWIRTELPDNSEAWISLSTDIKNTTSGSINGILRGTINPGEVQFTKEVSLSASEVKSININKDEFDQLKINNPQLWWPNGVGEQNLYTCNLEFVVDGEVSSTENITFGIKKYEYKTENGALVFYINGKKIFLKGGNWGMSEYLLRCRGKEYETKIKLHVDMNFNTIRNWMGSVTDEEFYEYCDQYGIMVWDDFWLNSMIGLPDDKEEFKSNAIEKIKRLRNHPCVALWCGCNEGEPDGGGPLDEDLRNLVAQYDSNDRRYQSNSRKGGGLSGSGTWTNIPPKDYFSDGPLGWGGDYGDTSGWGMRTELGIATFTTFESFKEFMPPSTWWPRNEMWNKHFFGSSASNASPDHYFETVKSNYGESQDAEEFCEKSQYLNLEVTKAIYESWNDHLWNDASGILLWMSQSAYPSFVWQTYDYYHDATGAYWGAKKGCEQVHMQWNCSNNSVKIINTTYQDRSNLTAQATVYNLDGSIYTPLSKSIKINATANASTECFILNETNLALNKLVVASSVDSDDRTAVKAVDGDTGTRWSSGYSDNEWLYIDLGQQTEFASIALRWEAAYGRQYKIQISDNATQWTDIYMQENGKGGYETISFPKAKARYVKMQGIKRSTTFGYSLYEFEVFEETNDNPVSETNFIKLLLSDEEGNLISDNFYWRNMDEDDYTALNTLPEADLLSSFKEYKTDGKRKIEFQITNNSSSVVFGIRVRVVNKRTGKRILPVYMDDNYFTMLPNETKELNIEFDEELIGDDLAEVLVKQYGKEETITSIEEEKAEKKKFQCKIYPNPASDFLLVDAGHEEVLSVKVYNINGNLELQEKKSTKIDVSGLVKGMYVVKIYTNKNIYTSKLLIK